MENNRKIFGLKWTLLIFFLYYVKHVTSSPLKNPNLCGFPACEHSKKFNYLLDTNYVYKYSVDVATLFRGTSENRSTLYVEALATLRFIAPCQGVLQLSQISLTEEKPGYNREEDEDIVSPQLPKADSFAEALSRYSLRFSFNDGAIGELCPTADDPVWVLNFKRGVLSAFHNTMKRFDVDHDSVETDVNGDCSTLYRLQEARGTSLVINKSKRLYSCTNRYKYHTIIQANQYNFGSDFKTVPLVKSRHQCEFAVDHKIYTHIECEEIHTFQPFSKVENGSQTITRQRLHLISEDSVNSTMPETIERRTDLLFDHNATPKPTSGELKASRDLIKALCKLDVDDVQVNYPDAFTKFIQVGRHLSYTALIQIYNRANSICSTGKKHVMDAFPYLGSNAAVMVMKDAILKGSVPRDTVHEWLFSISLIPNPDEETLSAALPLIYHPNAKNESQYLLSVSALAHSYCRHHSNCQNSLYIQEILNHLEKEVDEGCSLGYRGRESQEQILIALKSLGNIGLTTDTLEEKVFKCVENEALIMDVRVAAVQSYRRLPCDIDRDYFLKVFRNATYDTEIRIAAYLEIMRCPNYFVVSTLRMALEEEEVNQVGSFVWSHLTNLLKSSMPSKVEIQSLLTDKNLSEKFDIDRRKFSRNYEQSMFFDEYNVGGNIESNIIFSPKSYIPRSGMLNLTVDLFGESINVFEMETRAEGFEHILEFAFGPRGPFSASVVNKEIDKYLRMIRSVQEEDPVVRQVNEIPNVIDNNFKTPKLSLGMKMFGNEYSYTNLVGHEELMSLVDKLNPEKRIKQLLSGKELNFDKASMFLDADYIVPTGVGFPVTLTAVGTAAAHLSMAGNVKKFELFDLDIEGKFRPSVAIDITGHMGVDAYYASTGIKLKTSLYSSTAVEGNIKVEGTHSAKVSFNLPKEKIEIITAQSELIVMKGDKEEIQSGITENRVSDRICSWPSLDHTLGLKVCVDLAFPNATEYLNDTIVHHTLLPKRQTNFTSSPNFILSGPGKIALALYKADPTAKQYVLQYNWATAENTTTISFVYDTPGSEQHRELSARLILDRNSKNLTLLLQGVDNKFVAYGKYKYTPHEKYLDFSLDVNGKKHFNAQVGLRTKEVKYGYIYQPKLYLAINEEKIAELTGTVKVVEKNEIKQWDVNLEFKTKKLTTKLFGYISRGSASFSSDLKLDYQFKGATEEYLKVKLKAVNKSSKSLTQFNGEFALDTSAYKHFNFESSLKYQRAQGHAECKIEINTQPHLKDTNHIFTVKFVFSLAQNYERWKLHTYLEVTKPVSHIDIKLELKADVNEHGHDQKITTILILRYATGKEIITTLDMAIPRSELLKLDAKLNVTLPSFNPMIFTIKIDEKKSREYDVEATGVWFSGHNFTAKGIYIDKSEGVVTSHSVKLFLTSPSFKDIAINGKFLMDDTQFKLDLQAEHNNEKYAINLKHAVQSTSELELYGEVRYKNSIYSLTTIVNLLKYRQVLIELHLDQHRDIHITLSGVNVPNHKQGGIEVKWDANRDPSQRFEAIVKFLHPRALNYSADLSVSYPGRLVKGAVLFAILGTNFESSARLEWSPADIIDMKLGAVYQTTNSTSLKLRSQLLTPFPGWKRTSISGGILRENNLLRLNGSVWWQDDQTVSLDIYGDYEFLTQTKSSSEEIDDEEDDSDYDIFLHPNIPNLWVKFNASLISTVPEVKPMSAAFYHKQDSNKFDTIVHFKGQTNELISVNSYWELIENPNSTNITGTMTLISPYQGYQRGKLVGRLHYTKDFEINGVAELDLDRKKYSANIDGHVKSIRDTMLIIDVDTPIKSYSKISGRIGYSELNRHLTCLWQSPTSSVGFEILFAFEDTSDFDLMFLLATPLEFFTKVLLRGKLKPQTADFRIGLNDLLLGVEGTWRYQNILDLDYSYTLYTPLDGFKENGVVAKIVYIKDVDLDLGVRVGDVKIGVMLKCGHKPKTLTDLKGENEEEDENDLLRWGGHVAVDTFFYPTIKGNLDIDEIEDTYFIEGDLVLPNGTINLYDTLLFEDLFTIRNDLHVNTSYTACKDLKSAFNWSILFGEEHVVTLDLQVVTYSDIKKGSLLLNYTVETKEIFGEDEEVNESNLMIQKVHVRLNTPWEEFSLLDTKGLLEMEDNFYRTNLTLFTKESRFTVSANIEAYVGFIDASVGMGMSSPSYNIPEFKLSAKRDFTDVEKTVVLTLLFVPPGVNDYHLEGTWHYEPSTFVKLRGKLETPIERLKNIEASMDFSQNLQEKRLSFDARFLYHPNIDIKFSGARHDKSITLDAETPIENFKKLHFSGTLNRNPNNVNVVNGVLSTEKASYNVKGTHEASETVPVSITISLLPQSEGTRSVSLEISVKRTGSVNEITGKIQQGHDWFNGKCVFDMENGVWYKLTTSVNSTHHLFKHLDLNAEVSKKENGMVELTVNGVTPWEGVETVDIFASYLKLERTGRIRANAMTGDTKMEVECDYAWSFMEQMEIHLNGIYTKDEVYKYMNAEAFYRNSGKTFKYLSIGVDADLNKSWVFGTNATFSIPSFEDIGFGVNLKLPPPQADVHSVVGKLRYTKGFTYVAHTLKYSSQIGGAIYGTSGEMSNNQSEVLGNVKLEWGYHPNAKAITNVILLKRDSNLMDLQYNLYTPYHKQDTVFAKVVSKKVEDYFDIKAHLYSPKSNLLSSAVVKYTGINNMKGTVNTTTPFNQLPYAGANFEIVTQQASRFRRYFQVIWPNKTAVLDSNYTDVYREETRGLTRKVDGKLLVEIPLATRHIGDVTYGYEESPLLAVGHCSVDYNKNRLLDGKYKCDSESRAGYDKDVIDISLENTYFPLGAHYIHEFEYSAGNDGTNYPTVDRKTGDVFKLNNKSSFSLSGLLQVKTTHNGKDIKVKAIHANRTVQLDTDYYFLDHEFKHSSWISLDPAVWSSYDLHIINKTTVDQDEEHVKLNISYPKRNFTVTGFLRSDSKRYESEVKLDWDRPMSPKTVGTALEWYRVSKKPDRQVATISFKHPSFVKDVTINGTYIRHGTKSLLTKLDVDYSNQPHKKLIVESRIQDLSNSSTTRYRMDVLAQHPATKLDLLALGEIVGGHGIYQLSADAKYKRSFLNLQHGELMAMLNSHRKEVDFQKRLQHEESYLKARIYNDNPCCSRLNGSVAKTDVLNYTGDFFIDINEKFLEFTVNMTPDASETFHASGRIPDARNAQLNVWRDYDDASISDISYYLRLNHSRLVTSRLKWRPTLQKEVTSGIEFIYTGVLKHIEDTVDYWKTYTRSETKEAIHDIWFNAKPDIQEFLDNIDDLKSLETDFEEFKTFLNNSYNNNDFYIKDITGAIIVLVDELAIKGHIQSLPNILNEIWQIMGESGEAIRKSLLWIIETIKTSYRKAVDFLRGLLKGDSAEQITALLGGIIDRYDKLVKDLQVTVIRHLEQLWNNFMTMLADYWDYILKSIEPTFIKIVHYVESLVWQASNEVMDFLYHRKQELTGSPYFSKLANFTQDIDRFYKDITKNDTVTNIKKYSKKIYEFLKEKYFTIVPFGKEINEIIDEIINEFKELQKLPSINYLVNKTNEMYDRAVWLYESLDLGTKAQALITLIHSKLTDVKQTALQADSRYREAKTRFIFDTDEGLVLLEQKLPMSWHAFNETPKFEEVPEYRVVAELQKHLTFSNKTFWTLYYEYKPYTEVSNWFPPFKGQAIIAGTQFFYTFDKTAFEFKGPCEYLLARDFVNGNFSLVMTKDSQSKSDRYLITLVSNNVPISIDMFSDTIKLPKDRANQLPVQIDHLFVYRENAVVTIEEKDGFVLQCNMLFKVCTLSLSGWYYGKTAGLLGTMDHEKTTDMLKSNGRIAESVGEFAHSWALDPGTCDYAENTAHFVNIPNEELFEACVSLFKSKNSQFSTCFNRVNPAPFMTMCLNARKSKEKDDVCTAAVAYTQACQAEYTPLPIPDTCIQCVGLNGETIPEGENIRIMEEEVPRSSDVVFIVEAKECNNDLFTRRNVDLLLSILSKELIDAKIVDNRFAFVVFGGDGIYNKPRALMNNGNIFTTPQLLMRYFRRLPIGNGNEDIFEAIAFASHLEFRPGVSKTFIVIPCSNCDPSNVTIEYTDLREVLIDGNIKLHILMNNEFSFEKQRVAKIFYGLDGKKAFTKKDFKVLTGDSDLRRQATLPKTIMGYCAPLALETNGTIFTAKKLETDKKNAVKKFASVFGKRVALHAAPSECQNCECSRYDSGAGNMICHPCVFPSPADIDLCLNDYGCDMHLNTDEYDDEIYTQPDDNGNHKEEEEESQES